jgi:hypothetical protein
MQYPTTVSIPPRSLIYLPLLPSHSLRLVTRAVLVPQAQMIICPPLVASQPTALSSSRTPMNLNARRVSTHSRRITQVGKLVCPIPPESSHAPTETPPSQKVLCPSKIWHISCEYSTFVTRFLPAVDISPLSPPHAGSISLIEAQGTKPCGTAGI